MTHKEVFRNFKKTLPGYYENSLSWFQNGKNSIRVEMDNKERVIFTYNSDKDWTLETADSFINRRKKNG